MPKNGVENVNASFSIFHQKDLILKLNRVVNFKNLTIIKASGVIKRLRFGDDNSSAIQNPPLYYNLFGIYSSALTSKAA